MNKQYSDVLYSLPYMLWGCKYRAYAQLAIVKSSFR